MDIAISSSYSSQYNTMNMLSNSTRIHHQSSQPHSRQPKNNIVAISRNQSTDCSSDSDKAHKTKTEDAKYKTEMCKNYQATGSCNYGKKCRFAHGKQDLVSKPLSHSKTYKTKICKTFYEETVCTYGNRCHFKHDERSLLDIQSNKIYRKRLIQLGELPEDQQLIYNRLPFFQQLASSHQC